ncbi:Elongin-A [Dissostichus eleginoides]|uniref:Elongin-A n=1 Tax=Dissostichus eleginoides TaxID=100907 RepID=A0AAD9BDN4_DISEL|nr:Elongin-A [Dissostichus eleginoides]
MLIILSRQFVLHYAGDNAPDNKKGVNVYVNTQANDAIWFVVPPDKPGAPEDPQAASPTAEAPGSTAAGAGNLAGWAGMWSLSPGVQILDPWGTQTPTLSG